MALVPLVTVPDEGAADVVRSALDEVGIPVELHRVRPEDPYRGSVLAAAWGVMVPEERLDEARRWLDRVQEELADEVESQAGVAEASEAVAERVPDAPRRSPKISWALGLSA